jgi:hypothetical protein
LAEQRAHLNDIAYFRASDSETKKLFSKAIRDTSRLRAEIDKELWRRDRRAKK